MNLQIIINYESIEWDELSVWGDMYLKYGNWCYPASEWNDLICLTLYMWIFRLNEFLRIDRNGSKCVFVFADGDYSFEISKYSDTKLYKIEFLPQSEDFENCPKSINLGNFINEIINVVTLLKLNNPGVRRINDFEEMIEQFDILVKKIEDINL